MSDLYDQDQEVPRAMAIIDMELRKARELMDEINLEREKKKYARARGETRQTR